MNCGGLGLGGPRCRLAAGRRYTDGKNMTIDERIERLAERDEAIAKSIETLATENRQIADENRYRDRSFREIMECIARLVATAEIHDRSYRA